MKISYDHKDGNFIIKNKGREIGVYAHWADFNRACQNLADIFTMLETPELFDVCDCNPNEETR
jgi:hypothetical protein